METCFRTWALHPPQASPGNSSSYGASRRAVVSLAPSTATGNSSSYGASRSVVSLAPSTATSSPSVLSVRRVGIRRSRFACQANVVDEVQVADEKNWENMVIGSGTPVLVDFWAPWCGPCRMIDPVITELAKEYAGKIKCCKVNTDDCPNIASTYGIRSIPTVLVFKDGEKKESVIGAVPKTTLCTIIDKYLDG